MNKEINKLKKYFPVMKRVGTRLFLYRGKYYVEVRETYAGGDIFIDKSSRKAGTGACLHAGPVML